jgi:hypothetical protein
MTTSQHHVFSANPHRKVPSAFAVLKVNFSFLFQPEVAKTKSLLSRNRHPRRGSYQSQQGMMINEARKNETPKNKIPNNERYEHFKERERMKEETTKHEKLLSPKGAIVFPNTKVHSSLATCRINHARRLFLASASIFSRNTSTFLPLAAFCFSVTVL